MTEQTPSEARDLEQLESDLRHYESLFAAGRAVGWDRMREVVRDAADAIGVLRSRPTLDRERLAETIWSAIDDKGIRGRLYREDCNYLADAILAAVGQDTPEPTSDCCPSVECDYRRN